MAAYAQPILFFFCHECHDYEVKTSPHYRSQLRRFARRRAVEAAEGRPMRWRRRKGRDVASA